MDEWISTEGIESILREMSYTRQPGMPEYVRSLRDQMVAMFYAAYMASPSTGKYSPADVVSDADEMIRALGYHVPDGFAEVVVS